METPVKDLGIGSRINELLFRLKMNQRNFGESIGVSHTAINNTIHGKTKPKYEIIQTILKVYPNISKDWLLEGKGEMFSSESKPLEEKNSDGGTMFEALKEQYEKRIDELTRYVSNLEYTVNLQKKMLGNFNDPTTVKTGVILPMWNEEELVAIQKLAL